MAALSLPNLWEKTVFQLHSTEIYTDKAAATWRELEPLVELLVCPGDVCNLSYCDVSRNTLRFLREPEGFLAASIVPQHVDSKKYTVLWTVAGDHYFCYGTEIHKHLCPGVLLAFYDGHIHSLLQAEYDTRLIWSGFYWEFSSSISARRFFEISLTTSSKCRILDLPFNN